MYLAWKCRVWSATPAFTRATVGELPEQCAALIQTNINVQRLTVKSILEQNCEAAIHAAMLDPLTSSKLAMREIRSMMKEMFADQPEFINS